jgi:PAS domain S-box-containing protein
MSGITVPPGDLGRPEPASGGDAVPARPTGTTGRPGEAAGPALSDLLSMLLAVMPDAAVVVDAEGRVVAVNGQAETLFGYPSGQLAGRSVEVLVPERFRHPHRRERARYLSSPRQRPMGSGLELSGRHRDGTEFPVEISLAPFGEPDGTFVVAAVRDTTERKAATAAQAQLAAIVQSSLDAIVAITVEGTVTSWNPGATRLLGFAADEIVGHHLGCLLPRDGSPELEELLHAANAGLPSVPLDTRWHTKEGAAVDVAISVSPLRDRSQQVVGFSVLARDISARKAAEAQLRRQERLQAATAEIRLSMLSDAPLDATLELICRRACDLLDADAVLTVVGEPGGLRVAAGAGGAVGLTGLHLDPEPAAVAAALAAGSSQPVVAAGAGWPGVADGPTVAAPIRSSNGPRRALVVVGSSGRRPFTGDEMAMIDDLASAAALGGELARAREDREHVLLVGDRERIARDLHDLVIQRLFGSGMGLQGVLPLIDNPLAAERVATAVDDLDATIREIRTTIFALEKPPAATGGVRAEILQLAGSLGGELGFEPDVHFDGPVDSIVSDVVRPHVLAVAREALTNVARHASATKAEIDLSASDDVVLVVTDDGVGLGDPGRTSGLANMRARAEALGGTLLLGGRPGGGTRIEWRVPAAGRP